MAYLLTRDPSTLSVGLLMGDISQRLMIPPASSWIAAPMLFVPTKAMHPRCSVGAFLNRPLSLLPAALTKYATSIPRALRHLLGTCTSIQAGFSRSTALQTTFLRHLMALQRSGAQTLS
eukprot:27602_1